MLTIGSTIYLSLAEGTDSAPTLRAGTIVTEDGGGWVVDFAGGLPPTEGLEAAAFGEVRGKFYAHQVRLSGFSGGEGAPTRLRMEMLSEPKPADKRQIFRVSVRHMRLTARVGREKNCPVLDMSAEGIALIAKEKYRVGEHIDLTMNVEKVELAGRARVQSVRQTTDGQFRYGLLISQRKGEMRKALQTISSRIQRQQLQAAAA